eukprot:tig00001042_g6581.t1
MAESKMASEKRSRPGSGRKTVDLGGENLRGLLFTFRASDKTEAGRADALDLLSAVIKNKEETSAYTELHWPHDGSTFVETPGLDPVQLAKDILKYESTIGRDEQIALVQRVIPILSSCKTDLESLKTVATKLSGEYFKKDEVMPKRTFSVVFDRHGHNVPLHDQEVKTEVGNAISPDWTADLTNPVRSIIVESFSDVSLVGVVDDYPSLMHFNLRKAKESGLEAQAPVEAEKKEAETTPMDATKEAVPETTTALEKEVEKEKETVPESTSARKEKETPVVEGAKTEGVEA